MKTSTDGPRIYVACLAAYNAGELHGVRWIPPERDFVRMMRGLIVASAEPIISRAPGDRHHTIDIAE